jgi:PilZ domain-containing protein
MSSGAVGIKPQSTPNAVALSDKLALQVQGLIDDAGTVSKKDERRARDRFPIPYTFRLIPISDDGVLLTDEVTTVVGKDISLSGVAFSHDHELRFRRAIVSLNHRMVGQFAVEAEIVWTRPTPIGLFESGCRLLRTLDSHTLRPTK